MFVLKKWNQFLVILYALRLDMETTIRRLENFAAAANKNEFTIINSETQVSMKTLFVQCHPSAQYGE